MNYCFACGRWRFIVAFWRCRECWDKFMNRGEAA